VQYVAAHSLFLSDKELKKKGIGGQTLHSAFPYLKKCPKFYTTYII
jgi:hypothetical protein